MLTAVIPDDSDEHGLVSFLSDMLAVDRCYHTTTPLHIQPHTAHLHTRTAPQKGTLSSHHTPHHISQEGSPPLHSAWA